MSEELKEFEKSGFSLSDADLVKSLEARLNLLSEAMKLYKPCASLMESIGSDMLIVHKRQSFYTTRGRALTTRSRPRRKTMI